jgi:hypothetical protein
MRYRFCDDAAQQALESKALSSARLSAQPVFLLREILQHLSQERIVAPAYGSLQDLVGRVVTSERDLIDQMLGRDSALATSAAAAGKSERAIIH